MPKSADGASQRTFAVTGWDSNANPSEPNVNLPGAIENLTINIVGNEVHVTWDAPTSGGAVTNYGIHQNPTILQSASETSLAFAKAVSPAAYAVTVHAMSAEGAGEATTVRLAHASYLKSDGTVVDPIMAVSGSVLNYGGHNLGPSANLTGADLTGADLTGADLTGANLTNAELTNANLADADLTNADLTNATLTGVRSGGMTGTPSALPSGWMILTAI